MVVFVARVVPADTAGVAVVDVDAVAVGVVVVVADDGVVVGGGVLPLCCRCFSFSANSCFIFSSWLANLAVVSMIFAFIATLLLLLLFVLSLLESPAAVAAVATLSVVCCLASFSFCCIKSEGRGVRMDEVVSVDGVPVVTAEGVVGVVATKLGEEISGEAVGDGVGNWAAGAGVLCTCCWSCCWSCCCTTCAAGSSCCCCCAGGGWSSCCCFRRRFLSAFLCLLARARICFSSCSLVGSGFLGTVVTAPFSCCCCCCCVPEWISSDFLAASRNLRSASSSVSLGRAGRE